MQLKLTRSQHEGGVIAASVIFCLDARAELTTQEQANVLRYKLGNQVIYSSETSKRYADKADAHLARTHYQNHESIGSNAGRIAAGMLGGMFSAAVNRLALNITVNSLQRGQHIECKDLTEVIATENALYTACQNLREYITRAATFDGREAILLFTDDGVQELAPDPSAVVPTLPPSDASPALAYEAGAGQSFGASGNPFDEYIEKFKHWWAYRTSGQRIFFAIAVLFVLYIIVKAL